MIFNQISYADNSDKDEANTLEIVKLLVEKGPSLEFVNMQDKWGSSALHYAARRGLFDVLSYFLKKRAKPNLQDEDGSTPLHRALYTTDYTGNNYKNYITKMVTSTDPILKVNCLN